MTIITIIPVFGKWDEAARQLRRAGYQLTIENTIEVPNRQIQLAMIKLWNLAVVNVIASFTIEAENIRAST